MSPHRNPRWIELCDKVLSSAANEQRSVRANSTMLSVMEGIIRTLHKGVPLSEKQAEAFIGNIRRRVPGHHDFTWHDPIRLTKNQLRYLRRASPDLENEDQEAHANHPGFTPVSQPFHTAFTPVSHHFHTAFTPEDPSNPSAVSGCDLLTERNETKRNETLRQDHSLVARGPDQNLEMIVGSGSPLREDQEIPAAEALSRLGYDLVTTSEEIQRDRALGAHFNPAQGWTEEERLAAHQNALQGLKKLGDPAVQDLGTADINGPVAPCIKLGRGAALDIWYDGLKLCRGEIQWNGAKYYVSFCNELAADEILGRARREGGDYTFGRLVYEDIIKPLSRREISYQSPAHRFSASPVYFDRNLNTGIFRQAMVFLNWEGEQLVSADIIDGTNVFTVELTPNTSIKPSAPAFKGKAQPI